MNELKDLEEEIYKCSRCGLCQSVCPVYKATLNECAVSRGKFNILNGIVKEEISLTHRVKEYLDMCTSCNACKEFCPSQINAKEIFLAAKAKYHLTHKISLLEKVLTSYTLFKTLLICAKAGFFVYRLLKINKLIKIFTSQLKNLGIIGKRISLLNALIEKKNIKRAKIQICKKSKNAVFFEGCFNQYLNSESKNAVEKILANTDIKIIKKDFECCGVSYLNDGNIRKFRNLINKNLKKISNNVDYIITDCASCNAVLKEYGKYTKSQKANIFSEKTLSVIELLQKIQFSTNSQLKIAIHKPCHEDNDIETFVKNIQGINFVSVNDYDKCCGFSGKFALQYEEISRKISTQKIQNYIDAKVDIILTTCPACILGLNQGLIEHKTVSQPIVMNLFVFLAEYCTIDSKFYHV